MRTFNIDFLYFHSSIGDDVAVEVESIIAKAIPNPASDWDSADHIEIVSATVYHQGEIIDVDIPEKVIYAEISARIRDAEINSAFAEESGSF